MRRRVFAAIGLILAGVVMLVVALFDIINDNGWMPEVVVIDVALLILLLVLVLSGRKPSSSRVGKGSASTLRQFRCPACQKTFTVSVRARKKTTFTHTCPECGFVGQITVPAKK